MRAQDHPRQAERVGALRRYGILDTPREEEFDEIVALVSKVCGTPIAVVNLIDEARQWFKAEVGLGVRETPLDSSICAHVILAHDYVEIPDTLDDPRLQDNPLCLGSPGLRFYAGALLKTEEGLPIGTLCVLDNRPRVLNELQRDTVRVLARQVMRQLDLRLAIRRHDVLMREIDHRVKNSLQAVGSLISLQRARSTSAETKGALSEVQTRVLAIASLHDEIHRAGPVDAIEVPRFMTRIRDLMRTAAPPNVSVEVDFEPMTIAAGQASSLAMVVNEFVTNSIKHAFPDGHEGVVTVTGRDRGDGYVEVRCADDGIGQPSDLADGHSSQGLGLKIIEASATQLNGTIRRGLGHDGGGFGLTLVFPSAIENEEDDTDAIPAGAGLDGAAKEYRAG